MLTPETRLSVRADDVAAKVLDGEAIIINIENGLYYSLSGVGGELWTLIENERSLAEMAATLAGRYAVRQADVAAHLGRVAQQLLDENLVVIAAGDGLPGAASVPPPSGERPYEAPALHIYRDMAELLALDPPMPGRGMRPEAAPSLRAEA